MIWTVDELVNIIRCGEKVVVDYIMGELSDEKNDDLFNDETASFNAKSQRLLSLALLNSIRAKANTSPLKDMYAALREDVPISTHKTALFIKLFVFY